MVVSRSPISRFIFFLIILALPVAAFAATEKADPVGSMYGSGSSVHWQTNVSSYETITLSVSSPLGEVVSRTFAPGTVVSFSLKDLEDVADGSYSYELRVSPKIGPLVRMQLREARAAGDDEAMTRLRARIAPEIVQNGAFTVHQGAILAPGGDERSPDVVANAAPRPGTPETLDQVIPDDLIVQGSACVGLDCVNNENFGFDTIRMKENNLRVHFDDTSTQAGFPANDWRLIANDSASGGSSKFSIEDSTGAKTPFTVTAGAATNSIFVDSTGRVGFRTSTPVLDIHISTSNTPAIRLEQTNAGGFTAQTWDIAGNEANFFVRDVTGGSRLPLRIRPGAPTSSIDISADGDVGMGTGSPEENLHLVSSDDANNGVEMQNTNAAGLSANAFFRTQADTASMSFQSHGTARTISRFGQVLGGDNEMLATAGQLIIGTIGTQNLILGANSTARLTINGSTGDTTVSGNFTVTGVKNFAAVDPADKSKAIYFSALEGPEAGTYYRGTAKTVNGEVVINLPGHFTRMTEPERMTVQLTPVGAPGQLYVASRTPEQIVIKVADGTADLEFDYLVQGVRKGYLDFQVERENNLTNPR